jgi:hypothetical protein
MRFTCCLCIACLVAASALAAPPTPEQIRKAVAARKARLRLEKQVLDRNQAVAEADTKLLRLDAGGAIAAYRKVIAAPDVLPKGGGDNSKVRASMGLARAFAEKADFIQARHWLAYHQQQYFNRGGNEHEALKTEAHILTAVWSAAASADAQNRLEAIAGGRFQPRRDPINLKTEGRQKQNAAREASLLLGERLQRRGDLARARSWFTKAVGDERSGGWVAKMATAHLRAMEAGQKPRGK